MAPSINAGNVGVRNLAALVRSIENANENRDNPIVLVSGFSGWGEALFGTINYWGGFEDLPTALLNNKYIVIVVRIGPLSSNMERACEIYAQLTNGVFDRPGNPPTRIPVQYGTAHPALNPPFNPALVQAAQTWRAVLFGTLPTTWTWDAANPVHFICHSQGGTTARYLVKLLSGTSPGFPIVDSRNWIKSIVTLGTPHKGTTVTDVVTNLLPPNDPELITRLVFSASFKPLGSRFYDLQLDHWGFCRLPDETINNMYTRLQAIVPTWWQLNYHGFYDNSIPGIARLNNFAGSPAPQIYYFTMSFCATDPFPQTTLTAQQINSFIALFPLRRIYNPLGVWGRVLAPPFSFASRFPAFPRLQSFVAWFTNVANAHLQQMNYFSQIPQPGSQVPRPDMLPLLSLFAYAMGGYNIQLGALPGITPTDYQLNDGIVNTRSMDGPIGGPIQNGAFPATAVTNAPVVGGERGKYWHLGQNVTMDHADQIGVFTDTNTVRSSLDV